MYHDARQRQVGIISGREDCCFRNVAVTCTVTSENVTFLALKGGWLQGVAGPLKQLLFSVRCLTRGEVSKLVFIPGYEVLLSVEGMHRGEVCSYQFEKKGFAGAVSSTRIPSAGGGVVSIASCQHSGTLCIATQRIVTVLKIEKSGERRGNVSTRFAYTPLYEIHSVENLRHVSVLGSAVVFSASYEVWCISCEERAVKEGEAEEDVVSEGFGSSENSSEGEVDGPFDATTITATASTPQRVCIPHSSPISECTPTVQVADSFVEVRFHETGHPIRPKIGDDRRASVSDAASGHGTDLALSLPYFDVQQSNPHERQSTFSRAFSRTAGMRHSMVDPHTLQEAASHVLPKPRKRSFFSKPEPQKPAYTQNDTNITLLYQDGTSRDLSAKPSTSSSYVSGVPPAGIPILFFGGPEVASAHSVNLLYYHKVDPRACGVVQHIDLLPLIASEHMAPPPRAQRSFPEGDEEDPALPNVEGKKGDLGPSLTTELYRGVRVAFRLLVCAEAVGALFMLHEAGEVTQIARYGFSAASRVRYAANNGVFLFVALRNNSLEVFPLHCDVVNSRKGEEKKPTQSGAGKLSINYPISVPRIQSVQVNCCGSQNVFDSSSGQPTIATEKSVYCHVNGGAPGPVPTKRMSNASFNSSFNIFDRSFAEPRSFDAIGAGASPTSVMSLPPGANTSMNMNASKDHQHHQQRYLEDDTTNLASEAFFPTELYHAYNPLSCCENGLMIVNSNSPSCHTIKQHSEWGGFAQRAGMLESTESGVTAPIGARDAAAKAFATAAEFQAESAASRMGVPIKVAHAEANCSIFKVAAPAVFMQDFFKEYQKLRVYEELPIHTLHLLYEGYLLVAACVSTLRIKILQHALNPVYETTPPMNGSWSTKQFSLSQTLPQGVGMGRVQDKREKLSGDIAVSTILDAVTPSPGSPALCPDVVYLALEVELSNVRLLMETVASSVADLLIRHESEGGRDTGSPRVCVPNTSFNVEESGTSPPMRSMRASLRSIASAPAHTIGISIEHTDASGRDARQSILSMTSDCHSLDRESCAAVSVSSVPHGDPLAAYVRMGSGHYPEEEGNNSPEFAKNGNAELPSKAVVIAPPIARGPSLAASVSSSKMCHSKKNSLFSANLFDEEKGEKKVKKKKVVVNAKNDVYALMGVAQPGAATPTPSASGIVPSSALSAAIQEPVGFAFTPWFFFAFSDRPLKRVTQVLGKDQIGVLNYLHAVLFSPTKPRALLSTMLIQPASPVQPAPTFPSIALSAAELNSPFAHHNSQTPLPPVVQEDHGNSIINFYAAFACERLVHVVWRSWLGRANGGGRCFSPNVATELLRSVMNRREAHRAARGGGTEGSKHTAQSLRTRSYDGSEPEDYGEEQPEPRYIALTPCFNEIFVLGYLLLESNRIADCVDVWVDIDGPALIELAAASQHLWYNDVHPEDHPETPLATFSAKLSRVKENSSSSSSSGFEPFFQCLTEMEIGFATSNGGLAQLLEESEDRDGEGEGEGGGGGGGGAKRQFESIEHSVGAVIALYFPWLLVPLLRALRERYTFPVSSALRLLQLTPKAKRGLLTLRFLSIISSEVEPEGAALQREASGVRGQSFVDGVVGVDGDARGGLPHMRQVRSVESCDEVLRQCTQPEQSTPDTPKSDTLCSAVSGLAAVVALREMVCY